MHFTNKCASNGAEQKNRNCACDASVGVNVGVGDVSLMHLQYWPTLFLRHPFLPNVNSETIRKHCIVFCERDRASYCNTINLPASVVIATKSGCVGDKINLLMVRISPNTLAMAIQCKDALRL
eukprot:CAMPEP_0202710594 /NCGR_PEP_ID=MMETSP1385-20130828/22557_1 /ASSEMBLY_ACC=CAM_ASM_000861 /TAXON_ID=933848 /ORGANISM="Elphidium margaritaceum" /LENGTH=122 /DNA_ID=CAMNT_0049370165 /DNA_START=1 /DNA_END=369 /DNA_ORIENTATION=+